MCCVNKLIYLNLLELNIKTQVSHAPYSLILKWKSVFTRLCRVQHLPADSNIAVPQTVEQFGDVVQDDFLPEEPFLQQLLHLRPLALQSGSVPGGLHTEMVVKNIRRRWAASYTWVTASSPVVVIRKNANVHVSEPRTVQLDLWDVGTVDTISIAAHKYPTFSSLLYQEKLAKTFQSHRSDWLSCAFISHSVQSHLIQILSLPHQHQHTEEPVALMPIPHLFFDVGGVQGVVQSRLSSFVRFPGLHQIHRDAHVDTDDLMTETSRLCYQTRAKLD